MTGDPDDLREWETHPELLVDAANAGRRLYIYKRSRLEEDYGSDEAKELLRISKKHPGFSRPQYLALINYFVELMKIAKEVVPRHIVHRPNKRSKYAEFEDVDARACFRDINSLAPGFACDIKHMIVSFSIFYWYLK